MSKPPEAEALKIIPKLHTVETDIPKPVVDNRFAGSHFHHTVRLKTIGNLNIPTHQTCKPRYPGST